MRSLQGKSTSCWVAAASDYPHLIYAVDENTATTRRPGLASSGAFCLGHKTQSVQLLSPGGSCSALLPTVTDLYLGSHSRCLHGSCPSGDACAKGVGSSSFLSRTKVERAPPPSSAARSASGSPSSEATQGNGSPLRHLELGSSWSTCSTATSNPDFHVSMAQPHLPVC